MPGVILAAGADRSTTHAIAVVISPRGSAGRAAPRRHPRVTNGWSSHTGRPHVQHGVLIDDIGLLPIGSDAAEGLERCRVRAEPVAMSWYPWQASVRLDG